MSTKGNGRIVIMGLVTKLTVAQGRVRSLRSKMNEAAEKIVRYYCKKYKLDSDEFVMNETWIGNIDLYKSGERIDDRWDLINTLTIPEWAFDDPERYIREKI